MAVHILIELVYTRELPEWAIEALEAEVNEGQDEPERLLAWLAEQVMKDPNWAFVAAVSEEEDDAEADDRLSE
jgi:hypothetical protein